MPITEIQAEILQVIAKNRSPDSYLAGAITWAACGKDPGFTPEFLLDQAGRHTAYTQNDVERLNLLKPLNVMDLKREWMNAQEKETTNPANKRE